MDPIEVFLKAAQSPATGNFILLLVGLAVRQFKVGIEARLEASELARKKEKAEQSAAIESLRTDQVRGFRDSSRQHLKLSEKVDSAVHTLGKDLALLRQDVGHINEATKGQERRLRSIELTCAAQHPKQQLPIAGGP